MVCRLCSLQNYSADQMEKNVMGEPCGTYGKHERYIQDFRERPDGLRPLARHRRRWKNNIKVNFKNWHRLDYSGSR
jgi:hypothetical protein